MPADTPVSQTTEGPRSPRLRWLCWLFGHRFRRWFSLEDAGWVCTRCGAEVAQEWRPAR